MKFGLKFIFFLLLSVEVYSQDSLKFFAPAPEFHKQRFTAIVGIDAVGYGGSLVLLGSAWYKGYNQTSFHFFNDNSEWLQMDKAGHVLTSYYLGRIGTDMMRWSGVEGEKQILYGTAGSFLYMTGIEILDGFSSEWGFSWGDFSSDVFGTGLIVGQKFLQNSAVSSPLKRGIGGISLKYSFHQTSYPQYRSSVLGKSLGEQWLKDYNGQTYWMSFNISSFLNTESKFPKWLNFALGYGAEGMISGNDEFVKSDNGNTIWMERYRKYYLSLDIDLTKIKTRSHFLKTVFETISFIKIPAPALEMSNHGMKFHPFYY